MGVLSFDARSTIAGSNLCVNTFHLLIGSVQPSGSEVNPALTAVKAFFDAVGPYRKNAAGPVIGTRVLFFAESWWTKPTFNPDHSVNTPGKFNTEPIIIGATP